MKIITVLTFTILYTCVHAKETVYTGSTPAHAVVREFLDISRTDSIDFIRWKLVVKDNQFQLSCSYGLCQPGTSGFSNEKKVSFYGSVNVHNNYFELQHQNRTFYLTELNSNLVHMLDKNKNLLLGNGGWSFTLNNISPVKSNQFNYIAHQSTRASFMVFEGRTPCRPLAEMIGRDPSPACNKLKWYFILYTDPATGKPSHYLARGTQYRKQTMQRGNWDMITGNDGRKIYRLDPEKKEKAIHLLTADDTILLFCDPSGNLLVGNEDFSFTLSRTVDREPK